MGPQLRKSKYLSLAPRMSSKYAKKGVIKVKHDRRTILSYGYIESGR